MTSNILRGVIRNLDCTFSGQPQRVTIGRRLGSRCLDLGQNVPLLSQYFTTQTEPQMEIWAALPGGYSLSLLKI